MTTIFICEGEALTGKTILAKSLDRDKVTVIDDYVPTLMNNITLARKINNEMCKNVVYIACQDSDFIVPTLEEYLTVDYQIIKLLTRKIEKSHE